MSRRRGWLSSSRVLDIKLIREQPDSCANAWPLRGGETTLTPRPQLVNHSAVPGRGGIAQRRAQPGFKEIRMLMAQKTRRKRRHASRNAGVGRTHYGVESTDPDRDAGRDQRCGLLICRASDQAGVADDNRVVHVAGENGLATTRCASNFSCGFCANPWLSGNGSFMPQARPGGPGYSCSISTPAA